MKQTTSATKYLH